MKKLARRVIPANAGIHASEALTVLIQSLIASDAWIPAFAGMTQLSGDRLIKHLKNIFESGELTEDSAFSILERTAEE